MPKNGDLVRIAGFFLTVSITLFFFQGLQTVFASLFGIIYNQVIDGPASAWIGVSSLLLVVALVAPGFVPARLEKLLLPFAIALCLVARPVMNLPAAEYRYWAALAVILGGAFYLRVNLERMPREGVIAILAALILGQLLRNLGTTYDLSSRASWLPVQALWSVLLLAALIWARPTLPQETRIPGLVAGLAFGGFLFLELSLLSLPNGIARWVDWSYAVLVPALLAVTILPLIPGVWETAQTRLGTSAGLKVLAAAILVGGVAFGYFRTGPPAGTILLAAQAVLLFSLVAMFGTEMPNPGSRLWMPLGLIFFVVLNYLNAFAFTYPYTVPTLRGLGWAVYLIAAAAVSAGLLLAPQSVELMRAPRLGLGLMAGLAVFASALAVLPRTSAAPLAESDLTLATYNIHYGFDADWNFTLEQQAETIRASGADFVALQEVDAGRITSYGVDEALFLGRELGMQAAYLPTVEHLTGIAVLYRGPKAPPRSRLLTSDGEQTGVIGVELSATSLEAYGIWVGLKPDEAARHVSEALEFIGDRPVVALAGDFNLEHGSVPLEGLQQAGFIDPFPTLGIDPPPPTSPAVEPTRQIDFVWIRGLAPIQAEVWGSLASDHRLVVTRVSLLQ